MKDEGLIMTLEEARKISDHVTGAFAQKPRHELLRESQLRGYSFFDIYYAYALAIALRRQLCAYDPKLNLETHKYAALATGLVTSFPMSILSDEDVGRLSSILKDSAEYKEAFSKTLVANIDKWLSNPTWAKLESLDSFDKFCSLLDPEDPLYWQKIYSHLDLPYDQDSPKGMPSFAFDDNGRESWVVPKNIQQQKDNAVKISLLIVGVIAVIWFLLRH